MEFSEYLQWDRMAPFSAPPCTVDVDGDGEVVLAAVAGSTQWVGAVRDEGPGSSSDNPVTDADHRAQTAAGHRPSGSSLLRVCPHSACGVHLARDLCRSYYNLYRQSTLLPGIRSTLLSVYDFDSVFCITCNGPSHRRSRCTVAVHLSVRLSVYLLRTGFYLKKSRGCAVVHQCSAADFYCHIAMNETCEAIWYYSNAVNLLQSAQLFLRRSPWRLQQQLRWLAAAMPLRHHEY